MPSQRRGAMTGRLSLETPLGAVLSESRVRLLEAIDRLGSLNRAAREVPLSYKGAWDALETMKVHSPEPLVESSTGGSGGGGSRLTPYARQLVALYRAMESSQQAILNRLGEVPPDSDAQAVHQIVRRLAIRTSARNQFPAVVTDLTDRGGLIDVALVLVEAEGAAHAGPRDVMVASLTPEAVIDMALRPGSEVYVLIKAPAIEVALRPRRRRAGVNVLAGQISSLREGEARWAVTLRLPGGTLLRAAVTPEAAASLRPDAPAWAHFGGHQVVLLTFA